MIGRNLLVAAALTVSAALAPSSANAFGLSYSTVWTGASDLITGSGAINPGPGPLSSDFGHDFATPTECCVESGVISTGYGFLDDYVFQTATNGTLSVLISTSDGLGGDLDKLHARLYSVGSSGRGNSVPTLGSPSGIVLNAMPEDDDSALKLYTAILSPGAYSLQVLGDANGISGGRYSGSIRFTASAAPIPGTLGLVLGGAGLLMILGRRGLVR